MVKVPVDIISGFLGAGKTTLIGKLLKECYQEQKIFLLENEFGQVGIDGSILAKQSVEMKEIYSGCICCSLKGDFTQVLLETLDKVKPQRIIIEPTGVGKLSEIISIFNQSVFKSTAVIDHAITVVDATKADIYLRNFGQFYKDQVSHARTLILSKTRGMEGGMLRKLVHSLRQINPRAGWVTSPWEDITGKQILEANISPESFLTQELPTLKISLTGQNHFQHHSNCGCHEHQLTAGEVFQSWSWESPKLFSSTSLEKLLVNLGKNKEFGQVLRAKGIVPGDGEWLHFEYVSGDWNISKTTSQPTGRAVVIGLSLEKDQLNRLFEGNGYESC